MIKWNTRSGSLAALLLAGSWLASATLGAERVQIQDLSVSGEGGGRYRVLRKTSGPLPASSCRLQQAGGGTLLVLEFPDADSGLRDSYEFKGAPVDSARVLALTGPSGKGCRVEIPLKQAVLVGWEATPGGVSILLAASAGSVPPASREAYRLGIGDRLDLLVFGHDDLRATLEVLGDGTIVLPLAGVVTAAGKTLSDLRAEVATKFADYLVDPQVSLDIKDYRSQPVNVVGEVKNPGPYFLKGPTTLVDIIAQAGWMTSEAGSDIIVTRHESVPDKGNQVRQIVVDKDDLVGSGPGHNNPMVQAGDVITVGPKQYFYIRGEVSKPGQYALKDHPTLMKAISIAEGLTPYAKKKGIELLRTVNGTQTKTVIDLKAIEEHKLEDIPLQADDQILVPRRMF